MQRMVCALVASLLAGPIDAQVVGGTWRIHATFTGEVPGDQLGTSLAGVGDWNLDGCDDFIVGARYAGQWGRAYVYSGKDHALLQTMDGPSSGRNFGFSVSGAGDVDGDGRGDAIVGAPDGVSDVSRAYVISSASGQVVLQLDRISSFDAFGWSVDGAGDLDGDSRADLIVGAHDADVGGIHRAGAAYAFSGATGLELFRIEGASPDEFVGRSVAGADDFDGDGVPEVIVGALYANSGNTGSVFVLSGATGALLRRHDGTYWWEGFGNSVGATGDLDGDGVGDLIIGAPYSRASGLAGSGRALVFSGAAGNLLHEFQGIRAADQLGWSVSGAGDTDRDGIEDLVIGAANASPGVNRAGAVFLYSGATGQTINVLEGISPHASLGTAVAGAGDANGDGYADFLASEPYLYANGGYYAGRVYLGGLQPHLRTSQAEISASGGGSVGFLVEFGVEFAAGHYRILVSGSGEGPNSLGGILVPLTADAWFRASLLGREPAGADHFSGFLNAEGRSVADLAVAAGGLPAGRIGSTVHFAAVAADATGSRRRSSVAVALEIVP